MSPEQIQELARLVAAQVSAPPRWTYLLMLVCAAAGTFIGAYLKRRGENYATTADFDELRDQLVANTHATEGVKTVLAGRSWMKQQLWAQREKHYMDLLRHLADVRWFAITLRDRLDVAMESPSVLPIGNNQAKISEAQADLEKAQAELRHALHPAAVFLSPATHAELTALYGKRWHSAETASDPVHFYNEWAGFVGDAYSKVLAEARRELRDAFQEDVPSSP